MSNHEGATQRLVLSDDPSLGSIEVDLQSFFELSFWIAEELQELIEVWRAKLPQRPPRPPGGSASFLADSGSASLRAGRARVPPSRAGT